MAFTEADLAYLRGKLGTTVDETTNPVLIDDLETRYARLGTLPLVALEIVRERLADIANAAENPLSFTVVGEYSQDGSKNLPALEALVHELENEAGVHPAYSTLRSAPPARSRWRR
jgi:hypothetical protein